MSDVDDAGENRDVLRKADKFLARRRAQLDSAIIDSPHDDDIPVLTEIVATRLASAMRGSVPQPALPLSMHALNSRISQTLDKWLDDRLPQVVAHAMDGMTDKLIRQIHQSAEQDLLPRLERVLRGDIDSDTY